MNTPTQMNTIVGFPDRDDAVGDTVGDGLGDAVLGRAEHLHGLGRVLDRHFVEQDGRRLDEEVRRHDREQGGEAVLVVGERIGERRFGGAAARSDEQVDVSDFVAVTDERFADAGACLSWPCLKIPIVGFRPEALLPIWRSSRVRHMPDDLSLLSTPTRSGPVAG